MIKSNLNRMVNTNTVIRDLCEIFLTFMKNDRISLYVLIRMIRKALKLNFLLKIVLVEKLLL